MPETRRNIISLGAGVQSSTMLLMAACGELTPMPDAAVFADTQTEPKYVYEWLDYLTDQVSGIIPIHRVTAGHLGEDFVEFLDGRSKGSASIPLFTESATGDKGMISRQCTLDYKVLPVRRFIRALGATHKRPYTIWIGISMDEVGRMKPSRVKFAVHRFPLCDPERDVFMRRDDCLRWMSVHGHPEPPRSACYFCPFHSNREWRHLRDRSPEDFAKAVAYDEQIRTNTRLDRRAFLHRSLIPLSDVNLDEEVGQLSLWDNECEGMCGF